MVVPQGCLPKSHGFQNLHGHVRNAKRGGWGQARSETRDLFSSGDLPISNTGIKNQAFHRWKCVVVFVCSFFLVTFVGSWNVIIWIHMVFLWNRIGYNQQTMGIPCGQSVNTSRFLAENIIKLYQTIGWFSSHVWLPESSTCLGLFLYLATYCFWGWLSFATALRKNAASACRLWDSSMWEFHGIPACSMEHHGRSSVDSPNDSRLSIIFCKWTNLEK